MLPSVLVLGPLLRKFFEADLCVLLGVSTQITPLLCQQPHSTVSISPPACWPLNSMFSLCRSLFESTCHTKSPTVCLISKMISNYSITTPYHSLPLPPNLQPHIGLSVASLTRCKALWGPEVYKWARSHDLTTQITWCDFTMLLA